MPTGRSIVSTCAARAALAGNPSDGYGGAVVAVPITDLTAIATLEESDDGFEIRTSDADKRRLLAAAAEAYRDSFGELPSAVASVSTSIPRSVGLAGSSALIIALLRALGAWGNYKWGPIELAQLALSVERDRLGIDAGLQDRLVQAVGKPVAMTFGEPVTYDALELGDEVHLFVAWAREHAEPSDTVHRSLRRRYEAGDEDVQAAMSELAVQAKRAHRAIVDGNPALLADAMHRTMALRLQLLELPDAQRRLVEIGRKAGAAVNSAGSGGSVVGLTRDGGHLERVGADYLRAGMEFLPLV